MILNPRLFTDKEIIHYAIVNDSTLDDKFHEAVVEIRPQCDGNYVVSLSALHDLKRRGSTVWSHPDFGPKVYFSVDEAKAALETEWNRKFDWFQKVEG